MAEEEVFPKFHSSGITKGETAPKSPVEIYQLKLSQAARMADLAAELVFYTPAPFYLGVPQPFDPIHHFRMEIEQDVTPVGLQFDKPMFRGMSKPGMDQVWNHVLYGMPIEHWPLFLAFMGSIALTDRINKAFYRVRPQTVSIADPFFVRNCVVLPDVLPLVEITAFGVEGNTGRIYIEPSANPLLSLPRLVYDSVTYEDNKAFAEALFQDNPHPYGEVDRVNQEGTK